MAALNRTIAVLLISCLYHIGAVLGLAIGTVDSPHRQRQQQHRKNKQEGGTSSFIVGPVRCAPWFTIRGKAAATAIRSATTLATDGGLSSGESSARGGASTGFGSRANRRTKGEKLDRPRFGFRYSSSEESCYQIVSHFCIDFGDGSPVSARGIP